MSSFLTYENIYFQIPYEDRAWANNNGLKYDGNAKFWYLPPGNDPLPFKNFWSFLDNKNTYHDREELKARGCRFNKKLKTWYVPNNANLDFNDFIKWWPDSLKQFVLNEKFVIEKYVHQSGQSELYQAFGVDDGRPYAVKYFIDNGMTEAQQKTGFNREMEALTKLEDHKNILKVTDWGQDKNSRSFIISPWMPCGDLGEYIGATDEEQIEIILDALGLTLDLDENDRREFFEELANEPKDIWLDDEEIIFGVLDGIIHAHSHSILHRDIKPGNILIEVEELEGELNLRPVLCDFGTAKNFKGREIRRSEHTVVAMRTAPYRPEFIEFTELGDKEQKFQNTWDLFSWAILTIELMANQHVYIVDEALDILESKLNPKLGKEITDMLKLALSPDPEKRPADLAAFKEELLCHTKTRKKRLAWKE